MSFLTFGQTQQMTIWVKTGVNGYNKSTFASPVQRDCRWEDRTTRIQVAEGQEITARSRIFLSEDVALGDYIAFGVVAGSDPLEIPAARPVIDFRKTPSLDGTDFERKAYT
jgi:hypothetical protein